MSHIERIQKEGKELLNSSGWPNELCEKLNECLIDFTNQAFTDEMYKEAKLELFEDEVERTLDIIWKTSHLNVRVALYDTIAAHWDLFAGTIVDGIEIESESSGCGGNMKYDEYDGYMNEDDKWAFHFYWWLEDYIV